MKIASEAQRLMFEKAATDPDYAKSRGLDPAMAKQFLDAHKQGQKLPDRMPASQRSSQPVKPIQFLQSRRAQ